MPNQDAIDRKIGFIERMWDKFSVAVQKDVKGFFLVLLVMTNIVTFYLYASSLEQRLSENKSYNQQRMLDNREYSDRMIQEIRRQLMPEIDRRMDNKVEEIGKKVDSAAQGVDKLQETINQAIEVIQ